MAAAAILRDGVAVGRASPGAGRSSAQAFELVAGSAGGRGSSSASATRAARPRRSPRWPPRAPGRRDRPAHRERGVARRRGAEIGRWRRSRWTAAGATRSATSRRSSRRRSRPTSLAGRGGRWHGLGDRVRAGIEAAHGAGADGSRPDQRSRRRSRRRRSCWSSAPGVDRIAARELVLKVEEAAWVPAAVRDLETFLHGHLPATGAETALVLDPHRARPALEARAKRARQALAAAAALGIRPGAILARRRRGGDPRRAHAGAAGSSSRRRPSSPAPVAVAARRGRPAPARHARGRRRPAAPTPTRSAATTRATSARPSSPTTRVASPPLPAAPPQPNSDSAARSIISRSRGRKSWSMIRSTPAASNAGQRRARLVGRPWIQRARRGVEPRLARVRPRRTRPGAPTRAPSPRRPSGR